MGKFCGQSIPRKLISSSNFMTIKFVSDISVTLRGFSADYMIFNKSKFCMNSVLVLVFLKIMSNNLIQDIKFKET